MPYFVNKCFSTLKTVLGGIGTIASTGLIIYGTLGGASWVYVGGGILYLTESLFLLFDSSKVAADIRKELGKLKTNIDSFNEENKQLKDNVNDLNEIKNEFVQKNKDLHQTLQNVNEQVCALGSIKKDYSSANETLKRNIDRHKSNIMELENKNNDLERNVEDMNKLKNDYMCENNKLQNLLEEGSEHVHDLEELKNQYVTENTKLYNEINNIEENNKEMKEKITYLDEQLLQLKQLYQDSKQLLVNLANAGDMFQDFSSTIDTNLVKLDNTTSDLEDTTGILSNLVNILKDKTFDDFDLDKSGYISKDEFDKVINEI